MSLLENAKQYTGSDLEQIFFRPMLTGESALDLGVRVLYNLPTPTTVHLWDGQRNTCRSTPPRDGTAARRPRSIRRPFSSRP